MAKDSIAVHPLRLLLEAAKLKHPDIAAHGNNFLVECALSAFCGLPYPKTPIQRQSEAGASVRGKAKNPGKLRATTPRKRASARQQKP